MAGGKRKSILDLVALDVAGDWNIPLLENAAAMSAASLVISSTSSTNQNPLPVGTSLTSFQDVRDNYQTLLACETTKNSESIYSFPAPRGRTALVVGNELEGIGPQMLRQSDRIVSIPMFGKGMSSVNVAVAAAIGLYVLDQDLARRKLASSSVRQRDVDLLIQATDDPSETGSLLRSVWAFGWRKAFLSDETGVWFSDERATVSQSRAAARREVNPLAVVPIEQIRTEHYGQAIWCSSQRRGTPLSRLRLSNRGRLLVCYGGDESVLPRDLPVERVFVDHSNSAVEPRFRHAGSILLSTLSQILQRGQRG